MTEEQAHEIARLVCHLAERHKRNLRSIYYTTGYAVPQIHVFLEENTGERCLPTDYATIFYRPLKDIPSLESWIASTGAGMRLL